MKIIFSGSILLSIGINLFLAPNQILDGGFIGLSLILYYLYNLTPGLMIIILSIPVFIIAWFKNRAYLYNSIHGLIISSLMIDLFKPLRVLMRMDAMFSAIIGGILIGLGIGIMLRAGISTCGSDLLALFINGKTGLNVGLLIFIFDSFVITLGGLLLSANTFLLSIVAIFFAGMTTSLVTSRTFTRTFAS